MICIVSGKDALGDVSFPSPLGVDATSAVAAKKIVKLINHYCGINLWIGAGFDQSYHAVGCCQQMNHPVSNDDLKEK